MGFDPNTPTSARPGFTAAIPEGGIKAALIGGNTIGATIREATARSDGYRHIDTPALIARLLDLEVNCYFFCVWDSATDWDDLRLEFLPAAQAADITVIPYLVPPSETFEHGRASRPYVMDYVGWATAMAELSLEYPNLIGWSIDDFEFEMNAKLFTHEYMAQMRDAQDAINPSFGFLTCAYYGAAVNDAFLDKYGPFVDGIVYPFLDGENHNTQVSSTVGRDLDAITEKTDPRGLHVILLVYTGRVLTSQLRPTEQYADECVRTGVDYARDRRIAGVVAYGCQVDGAETPKTENLAMYGNGRLSLASPCAGHLQPGMYAEGAQLVRVDPDSARHELSFWQFRSVTATAPEIGDFQIQILVDGEEVWSMDAAGQPWRLWVQGHEWQGPIDITAQMRGKTRARLAFRLTALRDVPMRYLDVGFDHLEPIGFEIRDPGFETGEGWELSNTGDKILPAIDIWVPDRPERIFRAVGKAYGA